MTTSTPARENQIFKLPDGRALGYAEFGLSNGKPLLYFHGYPSSRLEPKQVEEMVQRQGIRLIALDRPGFGLSSPQPDRCMLDWTRDVKHFVKGIGLDKFAVMGLSGGGPYALATAYALPGEMLTSVGLFASGPPWAAGVASMTRIRRFTRFMALYWPSGLEIVLNSIVRGAQWLLGRALIRQALATKLEKLKNQRNLNTTSGAMNSSENTPVGAGDGAKALIQVDELVRTLLSEPFAQGAQAAVEEAKILSDQDWGFKLEDVTYSQIKIWHGVRDKNAPITMMRYLAEKLPNSILYESDDTHYTMGNHIEAALAELVHESKH